MLSSTSRLLRPAVARASAARYMSTHTFDFPGAFEVCNSIDLVV